MTTVTISDQRRLFLFNRGIPDARSYSRMLDIEQAWIVPRAAGFARRTPAFSGRTDLVRALDRLLREEENNPPESTSFLAELATREQFAVVVGQFAVDGLTEAQSFFPIIQRLPYKSAMAVFRVLVGEFGCGNVAQAHSQLYRNLLAELGLPPDLHDHLDGTCDEVFAFVNLFYWLAARAPGPEYFLGALAYLEASILYAFRSFASCADRLGLSHGAYYTEHLHIDNFHSKEMLIALREFDTAQGLDCGKAWVGVQLASAAIGEAVDAAVAAARRS